MLLVALAAGLFFFFRWLWRQPPRVFWQWFAVVTALFLLLMVVTGKAHWLTAVFAALLPFARALLSLLGGLPLLRRLLGGLGPARPGPAPGGGQSSSVQSRHIRMTMNHDSGEIDGEVLDGRFAGRRLSEMDLDELLQLLDDCADDEESVALLQAYLDRAHGDTWRDRAGASGAREAPPAPGEMSRAEALQILGLGDDASEADIVAAHRRLMQKLHPDRGGSEYLAARINLAKQTLLGR